MWSNPYDQRISYDYMYKYYICKMLDVFNARSGDFHNYTLKCLKCLMFTCFAVVGAT